GPRPARSPASGGAVSIARPCRGPGPQPGPGSGGYNGSPSHSAREGQRVMKLLVVDLHDRIQTVKPQIDPLLEPVYADFQPVGKLAPQLGVPEIMLPTPRVPVGDELLALAPHLRFVQVPSVGYERIDIEATRRRGVPAAHVPGHNAISVAEHVYMVTLAL